MIKMTKGADKMHDAFKPIITDIVAVILRNTCVIVNNLMTAIWK